MTVTSLKTGPASNPFPAPKRAAGKSSTALKKYAGPARNKKADQRQGYASAMKGRR